MEYTFYPRFLVFKRHRSRIYFSLMYALSFLLMLFFISTDAFAGRKKHKKSSHTPVIVELSPIEYLPLELFVQIGYFLDPQDRACARGVSRAWKSIFSWGEFVFKAQVNLRGNLVTGGVRYFHSAHENSHFTPDLDASLNFVRRIQLVGPYPGERSPQKDIADQKLDRVCHPHLSSLTWIRSSRRLPIEPLMSALPQVKYLRSLTLREGVLKDLDIAPLLKIKALSALESLDLSRNCLSVVTIQNLRQCASRLTLKSLILSGNKLGESLEEDEAPLIYEEDNDGFPALQILDVSKSGLRSTSRFLDDLGLCQNLHTLKLSQNALGTDALIPWLDLPKVAGLRSLDVRCVGMRGLDVLVANACKNLTCLNLGGNPLGENIEDFSSLPFRTSLETLSLAQCGLTYEVLGSVLSETYPCLSSLILSNNGLGAGSAGLLATTPHLPSLSRLALMHTRTPWSELRQLVCARPLTYLDMRRNMGVCPRALSRALEESRHEDMEVLPTPQKTAPSYGAFAYKTTRNKNVNNAVKEALSDQEEKEEDFVPQEILYKTFGSSQNIYSILEGL